MSQAFDPRYGARTVKRWLEDHVATGLAEALASAPPARLTVARLRDAGPAMQISAGDVEASVQAFHHLQRIRLSHQHACLAAGRPADNLVDPEQLNPLDRRVLVESLKQARRLQVCLKQTFRLEG